MDFGSSAATTWIGPTIVRTAGTPCRWKTATPCAPETVSERSRRLPTKRSASASSAKPPLLTTNSIATAAAYHRLKRRPPSSIIDGPTHWGVGPWWNWQHVWLWTRRFQVRVLAGQSGQEHPAEGWPSGLRRRPAKALTRKSLVGSNPTPSASLPPASPRRLPDGWPSGLRRTPGERVGSNPASWVRIPPRPLSSFPRGSTRTPARCGFEPSDRRERARGAKRPNPTPSVKAVSHEAVRDARPVWVRTERAKRASSASAAQRREANPTPSV